MRKIFISNAADSSSLHNYSIFIFQSSIFHLGYSTINKKIPCWINKVRRVHLHLLKKSSFFLFIVIDLMKKAH